MIMPNVIRESCEGLSVVPLADALFQQREIYCIGDITKESAQSLIMQLRWLQVDAPDKDITMYINSPGGDVTSGLSILDMMQAVKCPIRTVCIGTAYSIASLLFVAGSQRDILPHGKIWIHDPSVPERVGGSAMQIEYLSRDLAATRSVIAEVLAKHTGHTIAEVQAHMVRDTCFDASAAVSWGFADQIITTL